MSITGRVLIYGGRGALGTKCVSHFKQNKFWVISVDYHEHIEADINIIINKTDKPIQQESKILSSVREVLEENKLDGIFCVAGGWTGGNTTKNLLKNFELTCLQNVSTSLIAAAIAANHLKENGILQLTGAMAATVGTPEMIAYGMAKAAVHHLTKSLSEKESGLPSNCIVVSVLPTVLDTPLNRKWMPKANYTSWTPLHFVADLFVKWASGNEKPLNGSLLQLKTKNCFTDVIPIETFPFLSGDYVNIMR